MRSAMIFIHVIFLLYKIICQHLEGLCIPENQYLPNDQSVMLEHFAWVKGHSKSEMGFNVIEDKKFRFHITASKKWPHVEFWCSIKEKLPQFSEEVIKILLHFPTTRLCEERLSLYFSQNNILQQSECRSILYFGKIQNTSALYFWENSYFSLKICYLFILTFILSPLMLIVIW